jgi:putative DNA primase/helicase
MAKTRLTNAPPPDISVLRNDHYPKPDASLPSNNLLCTDYGNAERLVRATQGKIRYCPGVGRWLVWKEFRWEWDEDGAIERFAKQTARSILDEAARESDDVRRSELRKWSRESESVQHIHAMIKLAMTEMGIPVLASQLDANPMLMGVTNGVVDLRDGQLRPAKLENYLTKRGLVEYDVNAKCPRWLKFVDEIFAGDADMIAYVQRMVGYFLTGRTDEQCMFVLHGHGANGKTVFTETIKQLLGDYSLTIPPETLMVRKHDGGATPDLARLRGARLALAAESEEGNVLSASFIKSATGDETISCRELYGKPFEYRPSFKLVLTTNHKPIIKDDGHGMWRRMQLIPFTVKFDDEKRNPNLKNELLMELPGILNWAIEGCLEWQGKRLDAPIAVTTATSEYRSDMDLIGGWIGDCCKIDSQSSETVADLYNSYVDWNYDNGGYKLSKAAFGRKLEEHGYPGIREGGTGERRRGGLRLIAPGAAFGGMV